MSITRGIGGVCRFKKNVEYCRVCHAQVGARRKEQKAGDCVYLENSGVERRRAMERKSEQTAGTEETDSEEKVM
jgi:hypothetical protein